jgi:RHS repeat-associated protein
MSARVLKLIVCCAVLATSPGMARAQSTPGNASGSETGDTGSGYAGLASTPEANLFTGIAQTSIPIQVPPGRLGLAPVLALSYSSNGGPGPYGHGWSLPIPRVHRSTRRGVPRYDDTDTFVLEMPGTILDLERVPGTTSGYRAEIESAFLRIGFDRAGNSWKVADKLGVTFTFGTTAASRSGRTADGNGTFAWQLDRIEDPAGNTIDFEYRASSAGAGSSGLPDRIRYGANIRTGQPHFAEVVFEWSAIAHGGRVSWRDGFADPLDVRLASISTHTHGLAARRYDFSFEEVDVSADLRLVAATATAFGETEADDVQLPSTVFVYAPTVHEGWPSLLDTAPGAQPYEIPGAGHIRLGQSIIWADNVDLNGDAIFDRVDITNWPPNVWLGTGKSFELVENSWNWPPAHQGLTVLRWAEKSGRLMGNTFDIDGDSFADLVTANIAWCDAVEGEWCVWRGSATGFASASTHWKSPHPMLRETDSGGSKVVIDMVDVDADGRLDLVDATEFDANATVPGWKVYRNTGSGFTATPTFFPAPFPWISRVNDARTTHGFVDLNSDSLPDYIVADPSDLEYQYWGQYPYWFVYFNDGRGLAAEPVEWHIDGGVGDGIGLPNFLSLQAGDGTTIADLFDITGDGRPDLVRRTRGAEPLFSGISPLCRAQERCPFPDVANSAVSRGHCCFNLLVFVNTGSSFSQPIAWSSPAHGLRADFEYCPYDDTFSPCNLRYIYDFDFVDIDGDGLVDFVERHTSGIKPYDWMVHPHPASASGGRAKPNLLVAMRNGVGGETMLRYRAAAGTPDTRLAYPHWMVAERELRDSVYDQAPLTTSFAYRGGAFDSALREMRGFAVVQETDPAGNLRIREFHQDRRRAGRMHRLTNLAAPSCTPADPDDPDNPCSPWEFPLGTTEFAWSSSGPVLLTSETDTPIHGGLSIESLQKTTSYSHDAYGNVVARRIESPLAATTTSTTVFVHRVSDRAGGVPGVYLVSKPARVVLKEDGRSSPLVERTFEYEWESPAGALLAASTCMAWEQQSCVRWSRRSFQYDDTGNVTAARGPDGATSRTIYDASALFATRSVDPIGLETTSVTDPRSGQVTETVTPGGNRLRARFDGLGRLLRSWGPGTTRAAPLRRIRYAPGEIGDGPPRMVVDDAERGAMATFFDGLGRQVASKKESRNGDTPVSLVSGFKLYDEHALVVAEALPFESTDLDVESLSESFEDAPAWLEFGYDEAARLTTTRAPDGATTYADRSAPGILLTHDANATGGMHPGAVTIELFDGLGRRLHRDVCDGAPAATSPYVCRPGTILRRESWTYDGLGRVVEATTDGLGVAAGNAVTRIERDGLGNRSSVFHSNAGTWIFGYDDNGRPIEVLKPDGTLLETSYDDAGRIKRRRGPSSRASYSYHKDGFGIGKLRKTTTRTRAMRVTESSAYDDRGRIVARQRRVSARSSDSGHVLVHYRYDDLDRRVGTSIDGWSPERAEIVTTFGELGRAESVLTAEHTYVAGAGYDAEGRLVRADFGNGVSDLFAYDARSNKAGTSGHLRCARTARAFAAGTGACASGNATLQAMHYVGYDPMGRLLAVDDALRDAGDPVDASRVYAYDAAGRLVTAAHGSAPVEFFDFDPLGNVMRKGALSIEYGDAEFPSRITATRAPEGGSIAFEYDANGRRTSDGEKTYVYDDWDRLAEVWMGDELLASYGYSDTGERVFTAAGGDTELELGDGIRVRSDRIERTIAFAGRPVAVERYYTEPRGRIRPRDLGSPDVVFLHVDHQQSVTMVTNAAGRPVEHRRYRPFGENAGMFDGDGQPIDAAETRYAFTGHAEDPDTGLLFLGARYYDPVTASFLTLDPKMQFASPYAYSNGNPVSGRDPDGKVWQIGAIEILTLAAGTATFIDSIVRTGDLGHSLTAGVFAGFSVYLSSQLSTAIARPFAGAGQPWMQTAVAVSSAGLQALEAVEAVEDGRYAGGVLTAALLASSLIGIESAIDPGSGTTPGETQERHGIKDRGMIDGRRVIDVDGICATRPGCVTNTLVALLENFRVLFTGVSACVGGCQHVAEATDAALKETDNVLLRCNSFGSIKCLGAIQQHGLSARLGETAPNGLPRLAVEMSGTPLLRPPIFKNVTYQVNLFDPVAWAGTAWSVPFNSDVVLGKNWWVPAPLIVHHTRMYEKPFREAFVDMIP